MYIVNSRQGPKTLVTAIATKETGWLAGWLVTALPVLFYMNIYGTVTY